MPPSLSLPSPGIELEGTPQATECKGAEPATIHISRSKRVDRHIRLREGWEYHKEYCDKQTYVFSVELMSSSSPTITRTVAVPSWFTFQEFHFTLQYIFGPWQNIHPHSFAFVPSAMSGTPEPPPKTVLKIVQLEDKEEGEDEGDVKLTDIYDPDGALRSKVTSHGSVVPLIYGYDVGDGWKCKITFQDSEKVREARPLVKNAVGCAPIEDCGGIHSWNEVKEAFIAAKPTQEQRDWISWAKEHSGLGDSYDPLAPVEIRHMNDERHWENYYESHMEEENEKHEDYSAN